MNNRTRLSRLRRLRAVVELHKGSHGSKVQLNGVRRSFNMHWWDCGTSACALGSYALTPYGRRHFELSGNWIEHRESGRSGDMGGAYHFGLSEEEADYLFIPSGYGVEEEDTPIAPYKVVRHIDVIIRAYERGEGHMQR